MVRLLLLDFLAFCFVYLARALLNSTPQLFARERRAVAQGAELGPDDLRVDAVARPQSVPEASGKLTLRGNEDSG